MIGHDTVKKAAKFWQLAGARDIKLVELRRGRFSAPHIRARSRASVVLAIHADTQSPRSANYARVRFRAHFASHDAEHAKRSPVGS
ncbi:unnamed protein product [Leptidea sinapis]|uniref:Uncharacterized protein n=1 Tax=Leptidea sinapis TaxID=189913 RepID=A0A5E4PMF9_9NEOP|nr:unnamed protein product [Leptidea sinapis]